MFNRKLYRRKYYQEHKEQELAANKLRNDKVYATEEYKKYNRNRYKEWYKKHGKEWYIKNKDKKNARLKLIRAVKSQKLIKPVICEKCKKEKSLDGHHNDYQKPLEVVWLCRSCHQATHIL